LWWEEAAENLHRISAECLQMAYHFSSQPLDTQGH
jgi:hypothetical protein